MIDGKVRSSDESDTLLHRIFTSDESPTTKFDVHFSHTYEDGSKTFELRYIESQSTSHIISQSFGCALQHELRKINPFVPLEQSRR